MKLKQTEQASQTKFIFFYNDPEGPYGSGPEFGPDYEKMKGLALYNLVGARELCIQTENLILCLQQLELFILDELEYPLTSNDKIARELFIEKLYISSKIELLAYFHMAYVALNSRADFDLKSASVEDYFGGFISCFFEIIQD